MQLQLQIRSTLLPPLFNDLCESSTILSTYHRHTGRLPAICWVVVLVLVLWCNNSNFVMNVSRFPSPSSSTKTTPNTNAGLDVLETTREEDEGLTARQYRIDTATQLSRLTIVSMNVAGCEPSKDAPPHWNHEIAGRAIQKEVLRTHPDVLALQEFPGGVALAEQSFGHDYNVIGATYAHADQVVLLVRKGIAAKKVSFDNKNNSKNKSYNGYPRIPAVIAELSWSDDDTITSSSTTDAATTTTTTSSSKRRRMWIGSVHLAPFRDGSLERQRQVDEMLRQAGSLPFIFAGDTNMRIEEDKRMEKDRGLLDAWKQAGSKPNTKFTWDTIDHRGTTDGVGAFNRYYGDRTRQYTARYDRIYCTDSTPLHEVESFELIANQPITGKTHFLSDHFGISAELSFQWDDA